MKYAKITLVLGMLAFLVGVTFCVTGCTSLPPAVDVIVNVATNQTVVTPPVVTPPNQEEQPEAQTLWPAVECDWMIHGEGTDENGVRQRAIDEAAASGKAIKFRFRNTSTDFRFWVLWWESDKDRGKFPNSGMWAPKASAAGVHRWVVDIRGFDLALIADTFKAYAPDSDYQVQFTGVAITKAVQKALGCDAQGVKQTKAVMR